VYDTVSKHQSEDYFPKS